MSHNTFQLNNNNNISVIEDLKFPSYLKYVLAFTLLMILEFSSYLVKLWLRFREQKSINISSS